MLDETPKTQTAIIQAVQKKHGAKTDRKAVSRHLNLPAAFACRVEKGKSEGIERISDIQMPGGITLFCNEAFGGILYYSRPTPDGKGTP